jgi:hypothetical protein
LDVAFIRFDERLFSAYSRKEVRFDRCHPRPLGYRLMAEFASAKLSKDICSGGPLTYAEAGREDQ